MQATPIRVIDAHAHCGIIDQSMPQSCEAYQRRIAGTDIEAVAFFSPVYEIYDRYNRNFRDTSHWQQRRKRSNAYLLDLNPSGLKVYPYFFIWNDFAIEQFSDAHCGIKWHRHDDEPIYYYDDPKCTAAIKEIRRRNFPVVLEETFVNTIRFVRHLAQGVRVIIPHLGSLNGGFDTIAAAGLWEMKNVWSDTALASRHVISQYLSRYGHRRLLFGSDFPFGDPVAELEKINSLKLAVEVEGSLLRQNFIRLQAGIVPEAA